MEILHAEDAKRDIAHFYESNKFLLFFFQNFIESIYRGLLPMPILNRQFLKKSPSPLFSRKSYDITSTTLSSSASTPTTATASFATPPSPRFVRRTLSNKTASSVL